MSANTNLVSLEQDFSDILMNSMCSDQVPKFVEQMKNEEFCWKLTSMINSASTPALTQFLEKELSYLPIGLIWMFRLCINKHKKSVQNMPMCDQNCSNTIDGLYCSSLLSDSCDDELQNSSFSAAAKILLTQWRNGKLTPIEVFKQIEGSVSLGFISASEAQLLTKVILVVGGHHTLSNMTEYQPMKLKTRFIHSIYTSNTSSFANDFSISNIVGTTLTTYMNSSVYRPYKLNFTLRDQIKCEVRCINTEDNEVLVSQCSSLPYVFERSMGELHPNCIPFRWIKLCSPSTGDCLYWRYLDFRDMERFRDEGDSGSVSNIDEYLESLKHLNCQLYDDVDKPVLQFGDIIMCAADRVVDVDDVISVDAAVNIAELEENSGFRCVAIVRGRWSTVEQNTSWCDYFDGDTEIPPGGLLYDVGEARSQRRSVDSEDTGSHSDDPHMTFNEHLFAQKYFVVYLEVSPNMAVHVMEIYEVRKWYPDQKPYKIVGMFNQMVNAVDAGDNSMCNSYIAIVCGSCGLLSLVPVPMSVDSCYVNATVMCPDDSIYAALRQNFEHTEFKYHRSNSLVQHIHYDCENNIIVSADNNGLVCFWKFDPTACSYQLWYKSIETKFYIVKIFYNVRQTPVVVIAHPNKLLLYRHHLSNSDNEFSWCCTASLDIVARGSALYEVGFSGNTIHIFRMMNLASGGPLPHALSVYHTASSDDTPLSAERWNTCECFQNSNAASVNPFVRGDCRGITVTYWCHNLPAIGTKNESPAGLSDGSPGGPVVIVRSQGMSMTRNSCVTARYSTNSVVMENDEEYRKVTSIIEPAHLIKVCEEKIGFPDSGNWKSIISLLEVLSAILEDKQATLGIVAAALEVDILQDFLYIYNPVTSRPNLILSDNCVMIDPGFPLTAACLIRPIHPGWIKWIGSDSSVLISVLPRVGTIGQSILSEVTHIANGNAELYLQHRVSKAMGLPVWIDPANGHNRITAIFFRYCANKSIAVEHDFQDYLRTFGPTHLRKCSRYLRIFTQDVRKIDETANIKGALPYQLGYVIGLQELYARRVGLTGCIPREFGELVELRVLSMGNNHLCGSIPAELGFLRQLQRIVLHQNNLCGSIPDSLGDLGCIVNVAGNPRLTYGPDVPMNERKALNDIFKSTRGPNWSNRKHWCSDAIPVSRWYKVGVLCSHVHSIVMSSNNMDGKLPNSISALTELRMIELATMPGLTGNFPIGLCGIPTLKRLCICRCNLKGPIPQSIGDLVNLEELQLFGNSFTGFIPHTISKLSNLRLLSLGEYTGGNCFSPSPLPSCLSNLHQLEALFMANCQLIEKLPSWVSVLTELRQLDLQRNHLEGGIPTQISNCASLLYLNVKDNERMTGTLPIDSLICLTKLNRLSLVHCGFTNLNADVNERLQRALPRCKIWI